MQLPQDYAERVYAGVLGKIIGVYLGRPFEGWEFARIERELGEITDYVHERLGVPLIVTDDDISGTFTFIRALEDFAGGADISAADIGRTWLNYLIEERTVLWWGGLGNSTEHTAYLRLKNGIEAPRSGSIALNTKVVAEQIGAQIFIDGWAMVAPGDPELAAALAAKAGSVSHDGEAVYGAQVLAAMEAAAFTESNIDTLLDTAVRFVPADSVIARLIGDLREWHAADGDDWRKSFGRIQGSYGYDKYGGNCHMVPNHAIIILALLAGGGDFAHSLMIANTCGWDTDCNSGNVGCLLGIRGGLQALDAAPASGDGNGVGKWRGPVADRLYLPTADGGRCITDAVQQSYRLINLGRGLQGLDPLQPKQGARYHFSLPGSVQGFEPGGAATSVANDGGRLAVRFEGVDTTQGAGASVATFIPMDADKVGGYQLLASPTLHPGQRIRARVDLDAAATGAVACRLWAKVVRAADDTEEGGLRSGATGARRRRRAGLGDARHQRSSGGPGRRFRGFHGNRRRRRERGHRRRRYAVRRLADLGRRPAHQPVAAERRRGRAPQVSRAAVVGARLGQWRLPVLAQGLGGTDAADPERGRRPGVSGQRELDRLPGYRHDAHPHGQGGRHRRARRRHAPLLRAADRRRRRGTADPSRSRDGGARRNAAGRRA